jgi:hypothetical protein
MFPGHDHHHGAPLGILGSVQIRLSRLGAGSNLLIRKGVHPKVGAPLLGKGSRGSKVQHEVKQDRVPPATVLLKKVT